MLNRFRTALPLAALLTLAAAAATRAADPQTSWHFSFTGKPTADATPVSPADTFSKEKAYGYESGASPSAGKPFSFSVALPEGNYTLTATLGGPDESTTTVKAELRRLMLENIHTDAGKTIDKTFSVNLRQPPISTGGKVSLKSRETTSEAADWDDKLTLEFNGDHPAITALTITKASVPTVYILGDSTVCDQPGEPYASWGQMLPRFFDAGLAVANHAESGESLRSSLHAHRLDKVLSLIKPGDYLLIQFGHNDMKEKGEGVGAFTTYAADLKTFVDGAKAKGATPVVITPMNRKSMKDGQITNTLGDYPEAVRRVAKEENVPLIDLNAMSKTLYEAIGAADLDKAFANPNGKVDGTHHNFYGSYELAKCIVTGMQQDKLGLVKFLADDLKPFDPAHPDPIATVKIPPSPNFSATKPLGN